MGDQQPARVLRVPPGVAHGCSAVQDLPLFYITSHVYDPADEGRIAHDDPEIGYDWTEGLPSNDASRAPARCPTGRP